LVWAALATVVAFLAGCRREEPINVDDGGKSGEERRQAWRERQQAETPAPEPVPRLPMSREGEAPAVSDDQADTEGDADSGEAGMESEADRFLRDEEAAIMKDMGGKRSKYSPDGMDDQE